VGVRAVACARLSILASALVLGATAGADTLYLSILTITGENPVPGYPGAMSIQSISISETGFSIQKQVDKASPQILQAVADGTPLGTASLLFYNSVPENPPDGLLSFSSVLASAYHLNGQTETDSFATTTSEFMFLEVAGIPFESSTPAHSNVTPIDSLSISSSEFSVVRRIDSASPAILEAVIDGTPFPAATVLFYDSPMPQGPPDTELAFNNVFITAYQQSGGSLSETDTFSYETVTQPVPEPGMFWMMAAAAGCLCLRACPKRADSKLVSAP